MFCEIGACRYWSGVLCGVILLRCSLGAVCALLVWSCVRSGCWLCCWSGFFFICCSGCCLRAECCGGCWFVMQLGAGQGAAVSACRAAAVAGGACLSTWSGCWQGCCLASWSRCCLVCSRWRSLFDAVCVVGVGQGSAWADQGVGALWRFNILLLNSVGCCLSLYIHT